MSSEMIMGRRAQELSRYISEVYSLKLCANFRTFQYSNLKAAVCLSQRQCTHASQVTCNQALAVDDLMSRHHGWNMHGFYICRLDWRSGRMASIYIDAIEQFKALRRSQKARSRPKNTAIQVSKTSDIVITRLIHTPHIYVHYRDLFVEGPCMQLQGI